MMLHSTHITKVVILRMNSSLQINDMTYIVTIIDGLTETIPHKTPTKQTKKPQKQHTQYKQKQHEID